MSPPKKDDFADLFRSANSSSSNTSINHLSLKERQDRLRQESPGNSGQSNWVNLDIFNKSNSLGNSGAFSSSEISRSTTPQRTNDDPFAIFDTKPKPTPSTLKPDPLRKAEPPQTMNQSESLLDDDFTDAFVSPEPIPQQLKPPAKIKVERNSDSDTKQTSRERPKVVDENGKTRKQAPVSDKRDEVLAELIDIGFPFEVANQAIDRKGVDLQACVNYIMSREQKSNGKRQRPLDRSHTGDRPDDLATKFNDISLDLFSKASTFFNKSRDTVMKNIEHLQQLDRTDSDRDMPSWMKTRHLYEEDALERKENVNGLKYEKFDDNDIDKLAIEEFMRTQKQKDKERSKTRYENIKEYAKNSMQGGSEKNSSSPSLPLKHKIPHNIDHNKPNKESSEAVPPKIPQRRQHMKQTERPVPSPLPVPDPVPIVEASPDGDLLGLNGSNDVKKPLKTISTQLDKFQQSDYEEAKAQAAESFKNGDYDGSVLLYTKCLESLPDGHENRILVYSNISLSHFKSGNYKKSLEASRLGLELIEKEDLQDAKIMVNDKTVKTWYIKLMLRQAESLELLEIYPQSLTCYKDLVEIGAVDKKIIDGKRRVNNIVNPPPKKTPAPKKVTTPAETKVDAEKAQRNSEKLKKEEELKFKIQEETHEKVAAWSKGSEDNLRTLLTTLPDIIPSRLGFFFVTTKKLTLNDLMLTKSVKINYMKVISAIHPDKIGNLELKDRILSENVFIVLNKAWEKFKEQNGLN